jgi:hypothetical protein
MNKTQPATSRFVPSGIPPEIQEQVQQVRPFFWLLSLVLALIYGWSLYNEPQLRMPGRLVLPESLQEHVQRILAGSLTNATCCAMPRPKWSGCGWPSRTMCWR